MFVFISLCIIAVFSNFVCFYLSKSLTLKLLDVLHLKFKIKIEPSCSNVSLTAAAKVSVFSSHYFCSF